MSNNLPITKKIQILNMLCEGSSVRSISRVVDCSINTVTKLLVETGKKCEDFHNHKVQNIVCNRIEVDEIWAFCYGKSKKIKPYPGRGDVWTWTSVDPDTKLVISWNTGDRTLDNACRLMRDLRYRVTNRPQISSDGFIAYIQATEAAFGKDVDYGMLIKTYANDELTLQKTSVIGNPKIDRISTSAVERQNLAIRMSMRRFTRKTNAHSKKLENHNLALVLYFTYFNFIRIHSILRTTPAMASGITDRLYGWEEFVK